MMACSETNHCICSQWCAMHHLLVLTLTVVAGSTTDSSAVSPSGVQFPRDQISPGPEAESQVGMDYSGTTAVTGHWIREQEISVNRAKEIRSRREVTLEGHSLKNSSPRERRSSQGGPQHRQQGQSGSTSPSPALDHSSCFRTLVAARYIPVYGTVRHQRLTCYTGAPYSAGNPWCNTTVQFSRQILRYQQRTETTTRCCPGWSTESAHSSTTPSSVSECSLHSDEQPTVAAPVTLSPVDVIQTSTSGGPSTALTVDNHHELRRLRRRVRQLEMEQGVMIERLHREINLVQTMQQQLSQALETAIQQENAHVDCTLELQYTQSDYLHCRNKTRTMEAQMVREEAVKKYHGPFPPRDPCHGLQCEGYPEAICLLQDSGCCQRPSIVWLDLTGDYVTCGSKQ
eukprot:scpid51968/ scgid14576/ 